MSTLRTALLLVLLAASPAQAQAPPLRATLAGAQAAGSPTPEEPADFNVGTVAEMTALSLAAIGSTVQVTDAGNGEPATYDVVDESSLGSYKTIDGYAVLVADIDRESGEAGPFPASAFSTRELPTDLILWTVTLHGDSLSLPDSILSGAGRDYGGNGSSSQGYIDHATGVISDFGSNLWVLLNLGDTGTFTVTYERANSNRRFVRRDLTHFDLAEFGAPVYDAENYENAANHINWAYLLAKSHPTADEVFFSEAVGYHGWITVRSGVKTRGVPGQVSLIGAPDNILYRWAEADVPIRAVNTRLFIDEPNFSSEGLYTGGAFEDFWHFGNMLENYALVNGSIAYDLSRVDGEWYAHFRNTASNSGFDLGAQGGKGYADGSPHTITWIGTNRFEQFHGMGVLAGTYGRFTHVFEPGAVLESFSPGPWDDVVHSTYYLDGHIAHYRGGGWASDFMVGEGHTTVGFFEYVNPLPAPHHADASHTVWDMRGGTGDLPFSVDSFDVDVVGSNHTILHKNSARNGVAFGHGTIRHAAADFKMLFGTAYGPYHGTVGPADPSKAMRITNVGAGTNTLLADGIVLGEKLVFRNLINDGNMKNANGTIAHLSVSSRSSGVGTAILDNVTLPDRPGSLVETPPSAIAAGLDVIVKDSEVEYGNVLARQREALQGDVDDEDYAARTRVIVQGSTIQPISGSGTNAHLTDRVLKVWNSTDTAGRTSEEAGQVVTDASDEGLSAVTIPTNLLWGAREVEVSLSSNQGAAPTATNVAVYAADCTTPYARPVPSATDYKSPCVSVALSRSIASGEVLTVDYTARVTPLTEQTLARPRLDDYVFPSLTVDDEPTCVDLDTKWAHRDVDGNAGSLSMTYTAVSSNEAIIDVVSLTGSALCLDPLAQGSVTLTMTATDEAGTVTRGATSVIAVPAVVPDPMTVSGIVGLYSVSAPDGLLNASGDPFVPEVGQPVYGMADLSGSGCDFVYDETTENPPPTLEIGDTFELRGFEATQFRGAELKSACTINTASVTVVALVRHADDGKNNFLAAQDESYREFGFGVHDGPNRQRLWMGTTQTVTGSVITSNQNVVLSWVLGAGSQELYASGVLGNTGSRTSYHTAPLSLFDPGHGGGWGGGVVAFAIANGPLTDADRELLESWAPTQGGAPSVSE